jgi:signal transduction histidine kinase
MTDDYRDKDRLYFASSRKYQEFNQLSKALNQMIEKIEKNKDSLQDAFNQLAQANKDLKNAQDEIVKAEKLASIGRLSAGIAHEIGNPIGIVLGYLELIRQPDLGPEELSDFTRRAEQEIQRINTIIRQLLDLARPKESKPQQISVHAVLEDIAGVMGMQPMMSEIEIDLQLEAQQESLLTNVEQLRQVFLNLLLNAGDAIADVRGLSQGRIEIKTWNEQPGSPKMPAVLAISFEDNGNGIPSDQVESVFDPFYTTKEPGKGTGLGLAVSYMIIEKMGGNISVQSRMNAGTRFTIVLPLERTMAETDLEDSASSSVMKSIMG